MCEQRRQLPASAAARGRPALQGYRARAIPDRRVLHGLGEGYVIYAPGQPPIYLISDKQGGFIVQRPGESAAFVTRRKDDSGWNILSANAPATMFLKNPEGAGWILQPPGELPTLIVPLPQ